MSPLYSVGTYDQTLPFYAQRTLKLVAYRGELDFGLRHDPAAEIPSIADFISQWQAVPPATPSWRYRCSMSCRVAEFPCGRSQGYSPHTGGAAMSWVTWVLILMGVGLNATAQLLLKVATRPLAHFADFGLQTLLTSIGILARSLPFWIGMFCYGTSLCVWLAALSKAPVSTAYPMLSVGYVVVACVSVLCWAKPCRRLRCSASP